MFRLKVLSHVLSKQNLKWLPQCLEQNRQIHTQIPLYFQSTHILSAEPMKKKKRVDPMVLRRQDERRRKRIEKQIRFLQRNEKQLKPVEELEVDRKLIEEKTVRARKLPSLTDEIIKHRVTLKREWSDYKRGQFQNDLDCAKRLVASAERALNQLRSESEELYKEAIQLDPFLIPYTINGPVETPPLPTYEPADGIYTDKTRVWSKRSVVPTNTFKKKK